VSKDRITLNNELAKIRKESIIASLSYCISVRLEGLSTGISVRFEGPRAEVRIWELPDTRQAWYWLSPDVSSTFCDFSELETGVRDNGHRIYVIER
jgi:hypothetical protein